MCDKVDERNLERVLNVERRMQNGILFAWSLHRPHGDEYDP